MNSVRIGLVRHFEVRRGWPNGWLTAAEIEQWRREYEASEVIPREVALGETPWRRCFASDLPRAYRTAQSIFRGPVKPLPQLREAEVAPFHTGRLRLPVLGWRLLVRAAWLTAHRSQRAARDMFLVNVRHVAREVLHPQSEHTLVVSHAGVMLFLRRELRALGYAGPRFTVAEHGRLYVFERRAGFDNRARGGVSEERR